MNMNIPYAISDFEDIVTGGYYYIDRTGYIPLVENSGKYLLFLRPRRFGKSMWLSTLQTYYDIVKLQKFVVMASGFERILWKSINSPVGCKT